MTVSVGIREFRARLADYIAATEPVAVTRHGVTVGWFIPTPVDREHEVSSLRSAASALDEMLAAREVDVDEIVGEYAAVRRDR